MLLYVIWNTILYPEIKAYFFLLYQGNSSNLSGVFTKYYWHILTKALHRYLVAVAETLKRMNCKPTAITNITQYATEPILHKNGTSLISVTMCQINNTVATTAFSFHHFNVSSQKQYLKLTAKYVLTFTECFEN